MNLVFGEAIPDLDSICAICLTLMWLETVLGLCLGCEIYRLLAWRGWIQVNDAFEVCPHGVCRVVVERGTGDVV